MLQADNLEALHRFMMTTEPKTVEATKLRDEWVTWWGDLTWFDKEFSGNTYNVARNRRNAFMRANATTPDEREQVEATIREGLTSEEATGGVRETTSTGDYSETTVSDGVKVGLISFLAGGVLAIYLYRKASR